MGGGCGCRLLRFLSVLSRQASPETALPVLPTGAHTSHPPRPNTSLVTSWQKRVSSLIIIVHFANINLELRHPNYIFPGESRDCEDELVETRLSPENGHQGLATPPATPAGQLLLSLPSGKLVRGAPGQLSSGYQRASEPRLERRCRAEGRTRGLATGCNHLRNPKNFTLAHLRIWFLLSLTLQRVG